LRKAGGQLPFGIPRDLAVFAVVNFIWGLGEGLFIYFFPLSLQHWNMDTVQIGAVLSMIGVSMALVQVPAGILSDRFGTIPVIRAALILGVVSALTMAAAQTQLVFVAGMLGYGLTSFIAAPENSYITRMRGSWSVERAITFIAAAFQVGAIAGPMLGGWIAETAGLPSVFRYSTGLFLVSTLVVFLARRPSAAQDSAAQDSAAQGAAAQEHALPMASPLANPRFLGLLIIVFITIFALNVPTQLTSIYLQEVHQLSLQQIGITGTIAGVGTAVVMFSLGNLRAPTGMLVGQLLIAGFALLMWRGQNAAAFFTGYFFLGGIRLYRSMTLAFARPLVKAGDVGLAYGMVETVNALAIILAPLAAGFLYNKNPSAVYTASLAALAVTVVFNALLAAKKRAVILSS
jgi:MFS family permease